MAFFSDHSGRSVPPYGVKRLRFMKWLSKIFKGASRGASNGRTPRVIGEENMAWHAPSQTLVSSFCGFNNFWMSFFIFFLLLLCTKLTFATNKIWRVKKHQFNC